ncbi:MAG TPA: hypothetical protein VJ698_22120 [Noviherbaspirillum sp.]|nr:hypothetical protein [Noviherbaspirillum sp.]HJV88182.1 hypothetical protein [Noviherbaspirillum sp.]
MRSFHRLRSAHREKLALLKLRGFFNQQTIRAARVGTSVAKREKP